MGLVRLIILGVLVWLLVRLVKGVMAPSQTRVRHRKPDRTETDELVQDPHCGVYIPKETAVKGGRGELFCSPECRDAHRKRET